ncbi:MAG TPA: NUDIX domain-containing protein [Ktedonobacterales bacterium]|nr:NUDIX domain-containing protein [Ktedonobacterales bacterium]
MATDTDDTTRAESRWAEMPAHVPGEDDRPAVAVDVAILTVRERRLEVLLVRRHNAPFDAMWALPGCFVHGDESLEDAARRKLEEQTGVRDAYLEQLYTFGEPGRDPRMRVITVVYYALIRPDQLQLPSGAAVEDARLFWAYEVPPLAFDHRAILDYTLLRLRSKLEYTTIGFQLLGERFTLSELQEVYEAILNRPLDKRNFRKKLLMTRIVEPTQYTKMVGQHRPAVLYRFNPRASK